MARTALLYAAAGFAVLEFADIAFPRLGLPDAAVGAVLWVGILGFPVALVASWFFDIREQPSGRGHWLSPATAISAAALLAIGVGVALFWGEVDNPLENRAAVAPVDASIAVLPFENMSGDASNDRFTLGIHDDPAQCAGHDGLSDRKPAG